MPELQTGCDSLHIDVTDPVRRAELAHAIERGINTWSDCPTWLIQLLQELRRPS